VMPDVRSAARAVFSRRNEFPGHEKNGASRRRLLPRRLNTHS
jgi:hypothetical protein